MSTRLSSLSNSKGPAGLLSGEPEFSELFQESNRDTCRPHILIVDILQHRRLSDWETQPAVYDLLTRYLTEAFEDGPAPNGLPWARAVDPTASLRATRQVRTRRAPRVSVITATVPVDLTVNSVSGRPNQICPRFLRSRMRPTQYTRTSALC
jgi:hypothetical protein